ncbi:hypothetical protein JNK13_05915 [bacterium]|nr:hypothetical protein [bacterium]
MVKIHSITTTTCAGNVVTIALRVDDRTDLNLAARKIWGAVSEKVRDCQIVNLVFQDPQPGLKEAIVTMWTEQWLPQHPMVIAFNNEIIISVLPGAYPIGETLRGATPDPVGIELDDGAFDPVDHPDSALGGSGGPDKDEMEPVGVHGGPAKEGGPPTDGYNWTS